MSTQARIKSREVREAKLAEERRRAKRNRFLAVGGGVIIVGLVIAIIVSLVNAASQNDPADKAVATGSLVAPANATAEGAIAIGQAAAPVSVEVYLDYMCPYCGRFERANGGELVRLIADGTVQVKLYPLSFLDRTSSGTKYSTRSANAVATVADRSPDKVMAFNDALFVHQPEEGSKGLTDKEIGDLARSAGVPDDVVDAFDDDIFRPWIATSTKKAFDGGITGTPTVKVNGTVFNGDLYVVGPLTEAIVAAKVR